MNVKEFLDAGYKFEVGDVFKYKCGGVYEIKQNQIDNCNDPSPTDDELTIIKSAALERDKMNNTINEACKAFKEFNYDFVTASAKKHNKLSFGSNRQGSMPDAIKPMETKMKYKYEKVTDLTHNEIAKAMIDGEVFYNERGRDSWKWDGKGVVNSVGALCKVAGEYYRKAECDWTDKLDGTVKNGVLCSYYLLPDAKSYDFFVSCKERDDGLDGLEYKTAAGITFYNATPLTKAEIKQFIDNAPE